MSGDWERFDHIRVAEAAQRLEGVIEHTPLVAFDAGDERVELRLKLENLQVTGSFKARGAWNQISRLNDDERRRGVVACSSGNHAGALAWAAQRAGVSAVVVMPEDAYPNKIAACRERGAEVVLAPTREAAEERCAAFVAEGKVMVHPYDAARTVQGAGTVGLEIARDWAEVEVVIVPVGGGGLISGTSLALRSELGSAVTILGAEPAGSPSLTLALQARSPVILDEITTAVQGLCPLYSGQLNIDICRAAVDGVILVEDEAVFGAQGRLVTAGIGAEPAGAAAPALVLGGLLPAALLVGRDGADPLRVAAVVSGGNADPDQIAALRGSA
jgi:threonine dehydratase